MPPARKKPPKKGTSPAAIAAHFRRLVEDGTLAPGDEMPSQREVKESFDTSPTTVNAAFRLLKDEGLIETRPGVGSRVRERVDVAVTGSARLRRGERTGQFYAPGETSRDHWAGLRGCRDMTVAKLLDIDLGDEVVVRRRVHQSPGRPATVSISIIHVRAMIDVPEVAQNERLEKWWQEIYKERTSRDIVKSPERRTARLISDDEVEALNLSLPPESAAAVLVTVNVFHDEEGPIEVWEDVYPPGAWQVDTD
ncbi:GntR family transcriptional regulator [Streptomyces sp. OF3]|uniref:GntR family transcriptional regulator n=1 Tax=Streptomyces alkaliterrae TaxID=2213162 RepID=A0A7W3WID1_9ACTN|nr:GntR family transcriptional regulator [Streptomyces alkaliterrae]MBB1252906.1 GntR family transcriptional regulator [Streptomyces alkaliterrae]